MSSIVSAAKGMPSLSRHADRFLKTTTPKAGVVIGSKSCALASRELSIVGTDLSKKSGEKTPSRSLF